MESAKVVNKILLSYLALGATFGIGILVKDNNVQKALMGTGAAASMACVAGTLVNKSKKNSDNNDNNNLLDSQVPELRSQEAQLQQSCDEKVAKIQAIETDINSLQNEQNQLVTLISDLSDRKEQLETESQNWHQQIQSKQQELDAINSQLTATEKQKEALNSEVHTLENYKQNLHQEVEQLSFKQEQLEQVISPIEESITNSDFEVTPHFNDTIQPESEIEVKQLVNSLDESELKAFDSELETGKKFDESEENLESDVNPFIKNTSEELKNSNKNDSGSELELVDKLIGSFSESELELFDLEKAEELEHKEEIDSIVNTIEESPAEEESEDLMGEFISESEPSQEFSLESPAEEESEDLMMGFAEESEPSQEFSLESPAEEES
ncbi:hypothetical protein I4641_10510, partial [Waterburya agarophytonicola K14]